jgi:hypothetical protein
VGNVTREWGRAGDPDQFVTTYTDNRRDSFTNDAAGNLTFDGGQRFAYDAAGRQGQCCENYFQTRKFFESLLLSGDPERRCDERRFPLHITSR